MSDRFSHIVTPDEDGLSVYQILRERMGVSEAIVRHARRLDFGVNLDGFSCRTDAIVTSGQVVSLTLFENGRETSIAPEPGPLEVVYEDADMLVVNKPAGLVVHPSRGHFEGTLCNFVAHYLAQSEQAPTPHPVNRLDRETSGLILFAKHAHAQNLLQAQLHTNALERTYLAICEGLPNPAEGTIDAPIARLRDEYGSFGVSSAGKPAVTHYRVLASKECVFVESGQLSLVQLSLETGRTHQIRVHMSHIGCPLLGDDAYGKPSHVIDRCALHSWKLVLTHPATKGRIELRASLPNDMRFALEALGANLSQLDSPAL